MAAKNRRPYSGNPGSYSERTNDYIEGNTVRKIERTPENRIVRKRKYSEAEQRKRAEKRRRKEHVRKNQEKALSLNLPYVVFLCIAIVATVIACIYYLSFQSMITRTKEEITSLKTELSTLTNENSALEERINGAVDLADVYDRAINNFGMSPVTEDQIHYYSKENHDYVKQYEKIPSTGK